MRNLAARFPISSPSIRLVAHRDNQIFQVVADEGRFSLRRHRHGFTTSQAEAEMNWLAHLSERLPGRVPRPVRTIEGDLSALDEHGQVVTMVTWVEGRLPSKPSPALARMMGTALAELHLASRDYEPDASCRSWDAQGHFGERLMMQIEDLRDLLAEDDLHLLVRRARSVQNTFARLPSTTMLHADLYPLNVLHQRGQLGIIDFANAGPGPRSYDFAVTLRHSWPGSASTIQAAYEAKFPLSEQERSALPALIQARMLHMAAYASELSRRPGGRYDPKKLLAHALKSLREVADPEV